MAEGFLKSFDDFIDIYSAGTKAETHVNPNAIQVMSEMGIDISKKQPTSVDNYINQEFDYVITVCDGAKEICPVFTGTVRNRLHIGFDDPADATGTKEEILSEFRKIRNEILIDFFAFYQTEIKRK
jgi:arsenate reductase